MRRIAVTTLRFGFDKQVRARGWKLGSVAVPSGIGVSVGDVVARIRPNAVDLLRPDWIHETWSGSFGSRQMSAQLDEVNSVLRLGEGWITGRAIVEGSVLDEGVRAGTFTRSVSIDRTGVATVEHDHMRLATDVQGTGFATEFNHHATERYAQAGAQAITLTAAEPVGSYAWARRGFELLADAPTTAEQHSQRASEITRLVDTAHQRTTISEAEFAVLDRRLHRAGRTGSDALASVQELAAIPDVGKRVLLNQSWRGVHLLTPDQAWFAATPHGGTIASPAELSQSLRAKLPDTLDPERFRHRIEGTTVSGTDVQLRADRDSSLVNVRLADDGVGAVRAEHTFHVRDASGNTIGTTTAHVSYHEDGTLNSTTTFSGIDDGDLQERIRTFFAAAI